MYALPRFLCSGRAAARLTGAIPDACVQLKEFPELDVSIQAKTGFETDLRMLAAEGCLALYRVEPETVSIGRVIHARQDYIHILFGCIAP